MKGKLDNLNYILSRFTIDRSTIKHLLSDIKENYNFYEHGSQEILKSVYSKDGVIEKYNNSLIKRENPETILKLLLIMLPDLMECYKQKDIDDIIFFDTISDIFLRMNIYKDKNLKLGLTPDDGLWLLRIFHLDIFKLGSLQFEMMKFDSTIFKDKIEFSNETSTIIRENENILSIHIMEGTNLYPSEVKKSLDLARFFFDDKFADFKYRYFYCYSWILYSGNRLLLNKDSNIIKFMNIFEIIAESNWRGMAIERIFGCSESKIDKNRLDTSLQKKAAENLDNLGVAIGIIRV